ncbi:unnamed protein product [Amaranthus hypochondriacus]
MNTTKTLFVAASIATFGALKEHGFSRLNNPIRSLHQHTKNNLRSYFQAKRVSSSTSNAISNNFKDEKLKQSEDSLKNVLFLSCWGPN